MKFSPHAEALAWLRFGRGMPYVATEVGRFNADVLGADDKHLIEVEVKKSRADFLNDFKNKTRKHEMYADPPPGRALWVPNFFYFLVPENLRDSSLKTLAENKSPAGLAVLMKPSDHPYGAGRNVRIAKRPKKIHDRVPAASIISSLASRMASELITYRLLLEQDGDMVRVEDVVKSLREAVDWDEAQLASHQAGQRTDSREDPAPGRTCGDWYPRTEEGEVRSAEDDRQPTGIELLPRC